MPFSQPHLVAANIVMHSLLISAILLRNHVRPSSLTLALGGLTYPLYLLHQKIGYIAINAAASWPANGSRPWAASR